MRMEMNKQTSSRRNISTAIIEKSPKTVVTRRSLVKMGMLGAAATTLAGIDALTWAPARNVQSTTTFPEIQFDIGNTFMPIQVIDQVQIHFGPVYTLFLTAQLNRTPTKSDQRVFANALSTIESHFPYNPSGVFVFTSYGIPYFNRLPGGFKGSLVSSHMPRLLTDTSRFALEEAVPGPTDVTPNGNITKDTFQVPVVIENNDMLFTLRSDSMNNIQDVVSWLQGSNKLNGSFVPSPDLRGLFTFTSMRTMFQQLSLPHIVAQNFNLPYKDRINPQSPMWMGFADQQVTASGPPSIVTFQGNSSAKFTDATSASYFYNGSIQHLSHVIIDLGKFYDDTEPYTERVQYMFRSCPYPHRGYKDQFLHGGGPAFLVNDATSFLKYANTGTSEASLTAANPNKVNDPETLGNPTTIQPRMGHLPALQQSSRATDGTPIHIRNDGAGFDAMDVPDGSNQPKLQFTVFVPTAEFFRVMRESAGALQFQNPPGNVDPDDNGLERFLTATRRQNFLIPSRTRRAFPLIELT
jgi:hypothetical protein